MDYNFQIKQPTSHLTLTAYTNAKEDWAIDKYESFTKQPRKFESQHVMTYDSNSFKKIFSLLSEKELIKLKLARVYNTPFVKNEFAAIFQKAA